MKSKKKKSIACMVIAVMIIFSCFYCGYRSRVSGDEVLEYIPRENVTEILIRKTVEDGEETKDCGTVRLTQAETYWFYRVFSEAKLKDIGTQTYPFRTKFRYYVYFNVSDSHINGPVEFYEGAMEFYGDEMLLFDYVYGDRPAVHGRYAIRSSALEIFFESIFE